MESSAIEAGQRRGYPRNPAIYSAVNSRYASASFRESIGHVGVEGVTEVQLTVIRDHVSGAHARGLEVRYWDLPNERLEVRQRLWQVLAQEGVDVVSTEGD